MRLHIINPEYPRHIIDIPEWFAKQNGFQNQFRSQAEIKAETKAARLIRLVTSGEEHWIPRSVAQVEDVNRPQWRQVR